MRLDPVITFYSAYVMTELNRILFELWYVDWFLSLNIIIHISSVKFVAKNCVYFIEWKESLYFIPQNQLLSLSFEN